MTQESNLVIRVMGQSRDVHSVSRADVDAQGRLRSFDFRLRSPPADFHVRGQVRGATVDVILDSAGEERTERIVLNEPPVMDVNLTQIIAKKGLTPGAKYKFSVFDPQTLSNRASTVEVVGREKVLVMGGKVEAYRLRQITAGAAFDTWIDEKGNGLVGEGPLGMRIERTTRELAMIMPREPGRDLISASAVTPSRPLPDPEELSSLRLRVTGLDEGIADLADFRQEVVATDTILVRRDTLYGLDPTPLPVSDPAFAEFIRPAPLLQSDSPEIRKQAEAIVGAERDALSAARRINDWLFDNVRKQNVVGIPSALEALRTRRGDCNEHTSLYVALARSIGLPAQVAIGLVYMEGRFYYHAWPEVYVGRWIAAEPTLGQFPADATHLRLVRGDFSHQVEIVRMLGRIGIDPVGWEARAGR
jgi:transglutaminase-like putative cysteine protease